MDTQLSPVTLWEREIHICHTCLVLATRLRSCICYSENLNPAYPLLTSFTWQQCEIVDKPEFSWNLSWYNLVSLERSPACEMTSRIQAMMDDARSAC